MNLTKEQFESIFSMKDVQLLNIQIEDFISSIRKKYEIKDKILRKQIIYGKFKNTPQMSYTAFFEKGGTVSLRITTTRELYRKSRKNKK